MTFNEEEEEDTLVEEGPQIGRGTVYHRDTCHRGIIQRNTLDKRLPREMCFDQDDARTGRRFRDPCRRLHTRKARLRGDVRGLAPWLT